MSQTTAQQTGNVPEHKIGLPGGVSVAIWVNTTDSDDGPRQFRSVTISPRRYKDPATGKWKDSPSYRPADVPALIYALQKALEFLFTTPLPDQEELF